VAKIGGLVGEVRWAVEDGYQFTIYDYHNDLDLREKIEAVLEGVSGADRSTLEAEMHDCDARFIATTREVPEVIAAYDRGFCRGGCQPNSWESWLLVSAITRPA